MPEHAPVPNTCPTCDSSALLPGLIVAGTKMEFCLDCSAFWEAETRAPDKLHTPCDNCAFRPGSKERSDPESWKLLMDLLEYDPFYCHKRVPAEHCATGYRFKFTYKPTGEPANGSICMGFLAWKLACIYKNTPRLKKRKGKAAVESMAKLMVADYE